MVKVVDVFPFFNELDMLEMRLSELYSVVDYFVIVESTHTFAGNLKPLYYKMNEERYAQYKDKIIHVPVTDMPNNGDPWANESHQRNCGYWGLTQCGPIEEWSDGDIVLSGDCDEIYDVNVIKVFKQMVEDNSLTQFMYSLNMDMYYYNFNNKSINDWTSAKIMSFKSFRETYAELHYIRVMGNVPVLNGKCGWHLSYFGTPENVQTKIQEFSHQEFNHSRYTRLSSIKKRMTEGKDLFCRDKDGSMWIPMQKLDKYLPKQWKKVAYLCNEEED